MPRISSFYGITISMYFADHNPPHFHITYSRHRARMSLDGRLLDGRLPGRAQKLVTEWARLHADELARCWERVVAHESPGTIEPLL